MVIGTDVSLKTCRSEGYLMMEFKKKSLMPKGKLNPECNVRFFRHCPGYCLEEMYGTDNPVGVKTIQLDVQLNANDIWEIYLNHKDNIDRFIGSVPTFPANERDLISLAYDVEGYCGLE